MSSVGSGEGCALPPLGILESEAEHMVIKVFRHRFGVFGGNIAAFLPQNVCQLAQVTLAYLHLVQRLVHG